MLLQLTPGQRHAEGWNNVMMSLVSNYSTFSAYIITKFISSDTLIRTEKWYNKSNKRKKKISCYIIFIKLLFIFNEFMYNVHMNVKKKSELVLKLIDYVRSFVSAYTHTLDIMMIYCTCTIFAFVWMSDKGSKKKNLF